MEFEDLKFEFNVIETGVEAVCFFCSESIVPGTHYWNTIVTVIPSNNVYSSHQECFETFAWSSTNFVFKTAREENARSLN